MLLRSVKSILIIVLTINFVFTDDKSDKVSNTDYVNDNSTDNEFDSIKLLNNNNNTTDDNDSEVEELDSVKLLNDNESKDDNDSKEDNDSDGDDLDSVKLLNDNDSKDDSDSKEDNDSEAEDLDSVKLLNDNNNTTDDSDTDDKDSTEEDFHSIELLNDNDSKDDSESTDDNESDDEDLDSVKLLSDNYTTDESNTTDDYDYNELINDKEEELEDNDCEKESFVQRIKSIHELGRNASFDRNVKHINQTFDIIKSAKNNIQSLFETDGRSGLELIEFLTEIDIRLSSDCFSALTNVMSGVRNGDVWALKFLDASALPFTSGFAEGMQSNFGEYYECLDIINPKTEHNSRIIKGQYCLLKVILPYPSAESYTDGEPLPEDANTSSGFAKYYNLHNLSSIRRMIENLILSNGSIYNLGLCIPSPCSAHEYQDFINKILFPIIRLPLEVGPVCHVKDEPIYLNGFQLFSISLLIILTILVIMSTIVEIYGQQKHYNKSKYLNVSVNVTNILTSFSIMRNSRSLFETNNRFTSLDTIRLLLIVNVHISHVYHFTTSYGLISLKKIYSQVMRNAYEDNKYVFARTPLMIDALFTLSGFLLSFVLLRKLDKTDGRFNYFGFLFQRWLRFLVLVFGSILFFYLFPLSGDGPIWDEGVKWVTNGCKEPTNLVKQLFFVNNFRPVYRDETSISKTSCNEMTWFLATLLQLLAIGPIFIITYYKNAIAGLYSITIAIIISLIASISPYILFGVRPYLQIWNLDSVIFYISSSFKWYHFMPSVYATSFFVGIGFGFLMTRKVSFSRLHEKLFWVLSGVSILLTYLWHNSFWRLDSSAPLYSVLLWHSIGKLFFSVGFGWIYFALCTGRGGILNRFLSWKGFIPISRLSFGIYLLHQLVITHRIFSVKNTYVMTDKQMFENIVNDLTYDIILAYFFFILIESPFVNIFNIVFGINSGKKSDELNQENQMSKL